MKLYHGSNVVVKNPQILLSDRRLDFGTGFYLTSSFEQSERWAQLTTARRGEDYPAMMTGLKMLEDQPVFVDKDKAIIRIKPWETLIDCSSKGGDTGACYK